MSNVRTWTLTDVSQGVFLDHLDLTPSAVALPAEAPWSIRKVRLQGGLSDGVDVVKVSNGAFSFTVVPTRGMGLWHAEYQGLAVGWEAPVRGPVHPAFVNLMDQGGLGWLKGFDECIVRCGLASNGPPCTDVVPDNNGNPSEVSLTLHGRIANLPAHRVEVQVKVGPPTELTVIGIVDETMLFCPQLRLVSRISTVVGSNRITITDRVINLRDVPEEMSLLYHCNFGPPFLEEGARLVAPSLEVAPRDARAVEGIGEYGAYRKPTPGYVEQCYWHNLASDAKGMTLAMLRNAAGDKGVVVRYREAQLPCFTQWKNTVGEREGYVTGLEPGLNLPNSKTFERERGRVKVLKPGESSSAELVLEV
ncbi:MAG: aldose 1-epimerase family protein, partial [Lentisphaeria bacterium]|nr:aldose 1-epimerase family protein [Lentisphaeria bacterium]